MASRIIHPENAPFAPIELRHMMGDVYLTIQRKEYYIEAKWQGHITADNVVCAAQAFLELLKKHPCSKLLNDKSDVTGDWQDANDWLQFEWLPQVLGAGLRYIAHVYSLNMFSKLAARELEERITPQLSMKNFYERHLAETWLLDQDDTAAGRRAASA
ncbi:hypothetical protein [Pontibacter sp. HSC-14F20]|uniref:hypothetical protein n=1 Tax=Pontibacter sp. HSC-14F20 TaxID=2864136 RepID=UPI002104627D|nr:hypothetical protein [Pontibacter sp. HSC-14F20]